MLLDYNSLLLAVGFAAVGLGVTMLVAWFSSRQDGFMLTWSIGLLLVVGNVLALSQYGRMPSPWLGALALGLLAAGLSVIYGAAYQFRRRRGPLRHILSAGIPAVAIACVPFLFGLDGLAFILANAVSAILFAMTGWDYFLGRRESALPLTVLAVIYGVVGLTFAICSSVLIAEGDLVLGAAPENWSEDLNLITCIVGMSGIGALSLSLSQSRLASRHRRDAETDALTGLLNRRALFERHGAGELAEQTAVILFDLDEFKTINDRHGHAVGDAVLRRFATAVVENLRPFDTGARMGGEEFALVLPRCTPELAMLVAERIRALFETDRVDTDEGPLRATVSAGLAFSETATPFESALRRADAALYRAKRDGRNRVVAFNLRLVA